MKITDPSNQYDRQHERLEKYRMKLDLLLREVLEPERNRGFIIESRVKEKASFLEKAATREEVHDLVGLRVIVPYNEDVDRVCAQIGELLAVDPEHSVDKREKLRVDQTGYQSVHQIVRICSQRASQPEWKQFDGLPAEIQIRTYLQHAWAQIEHKLNYKNSIQAPEPIQRRLNNLSALLEVADCEFERIREELTHIRASYDQRLGQGDLKVLVNLESVTQYLSTSEFVKGLGLESPAASYRDSAFQFMTETLRRSRSHKTLSDLEWTIKVFLTFGSVEPLQGALEASGGEHLDVVDVLSEIVNLRDTLSVLWTDDLDQATKTQKFLHWLEKLEEVRNDYLRDLAAEYSVEYEDEMRADLEAEMNADAMAIEAELRAEYDDAMKSDYEAEMNAINAEMRAEYEADMRSQHEDGP